MVYTSLYIDSCEHKHFMLPCSEFIFGKVQLLFPSLFEKRKKICQAPSYNWIIKICVVLQKLGPPKQLAIISNGCGHSG